MTEIKVLFNQVKSMVEKHPTFIQADLVEDTIVFKTKYEEGTIMYQSGRKQPYLVETYDSDYDLNLKVTYAQREFLDHLASDLKYYTEVDSANLYVKAI